MSLSRPDRRPFLAAACCSAALVAAGTTVPFVLDLGAGPFADADLGARGGETQLANVAPRERSVIERQAAPVPATAGPVAMVLDEAVLRRAVSGTAGSERDGRPGNRREHRGDRRRGPRSVPGRGPVAVAAAAPRVSTPAPAPAAAPRRAKGNGNGLAHAPGQLKPSAPKVNGPAESATGPASTPAPTPAKIAPRRTPPGQVKKAERAAAPVPAPAPAPAAAPAPPAPPAAAPGQAKKAGGEHPGNGRK